MVLKTFEFCNFDDIIKNEPGMEKNEVMWLSDFCENTSLAISKKIRRSCDLIFRFLNHF